MGQPPAGTHVLDLLRRGRREGAGLVLHRNAGALVWRQVRSGHRPVEVLVHLPLPVGHGILLGHAAGVSTHFTQPSFFSENTEYALGAFSSGNRCVMIAFASMRPSRMCFSRWGM